MTPPLLLAAADSGSGMNTWVLGTLIAVYLGIIGCLGYRGFRRTASNKDYLLAGRSVNPFVMAMSYGAAFISTSALVGFGGIAGQFGMGLMWLVFMNIAIGIVVAFIFFGPRTRRIGLALDAHTFPEFMGNRFESNYLKVFLAAIIFLFMPLYSSVVLIGGARFLQEVMMIDYGWALAVFALVVAVYVVFGGLKGVMYVDAMMGTVMIAGMLSLLVMCYWKLGGVASAHQALTDMAPLVAERLPKEAALGHQGWTAMPKFNSVWWWTLVSSLMLGVGIGALAQPQLAVRFMTVKSTRELNRAVVIGSVFILCTAGAAYMVGALSNVFFYHADKGIAEGISGKLAIEAAGGNPDLIIPLFIRQALPPVILYIFSLTLLSAAMSNAEFAVPRDRFGDRTRFVPQPFKCEARQRAHHPIGGDIRDRGQCGPRDHSAARNHCARHCDLLRRLRGGFSALLLRRDLLAGSDPVRRLAVDFGRRRRESLRAGVPAQQGVGGARNLPGAVRQE